MKVWGLTGNIACGKSAVEALLQQAGIPVIDADQVARAVVEPRSAALSEIAEIFGDHLLREDGSLDRTALGTIVFADPVKRRQLEAITHPRIFAETARRIAALADEGHELVVVSAALAVESGSYKNYAGLAVITCDEQVQLRRLMRRDGLTEALARARIRSQLPQEQKVAVADLRIDNSGSEDELRAAVAGLIEQLRCRIGIR